MNVKLIVFLVALEVIISTVHLETVIFQTASSCSYPCHGSTVTAAFMYVNEPIS